MEETVERECPVCRKTYRARVGRLRHGRETTCSRACSYERRVAARRTAEEVVCATCEKTFASVPSKGARRRHGAAFCSRVCHYAGRSIGVTKRVVVAPYEISEEARATNSRKAAIEYARGRSLPIPETERLVSDALASDGVEFVHQCVFEWERGAFCVDFYFPSLSLVVEIDGDYHRKVQYAARDLDRDEWLSRAGIRTVRVGNEGAVDSVRALIRGSA